MAKVLKHPDVTDYFVYMTLDEIAARPKGVMDIFEDGNLIIIEDYRLDFDFHSLEKLDDNIDRVEDKLIRRKLKKLESTNFFMGTAPKVTTSPSGENEMLQFDTPVRQALFDTFCRGDREIFERASASLKRAHDELNRIFKICFPTYKTNRLISSLRLSETLFENLHWDNHSINDDFHQARIFCNLDSRKRIWNVGDRCISYMERIYHEHDLARFAGDDPNVMLDYIARDVLGGMKELWRDDRPRHSVAFDPGEVWLGESRTISHQIWHGQRAMVYMWFVDHATMDDPDKRFNARIESMHERMKNAVAVNA